MRFNSVHLSSRRILAVASVLLFFSCTSEEQATRLGEAGAKNNSGIPTASVEGNLKLLTEGPISVEEGSSLENSDVMYLTPEVKGRELQRTLGVDVRPGAESGSSVDSLAKGEIVSSYLLHFDSKGGGEMVLSGTITVLDPVVAVVTSGLKLDEGDE